MARFLFAVLPTTAHTYPGLAIALELVRRGQQVAFVTAPRHRDLLAAHGIGDYPLDEAHGSAPPSAGATWSAGDYADRFRAVLVDPAPSIARAVERAADQFCPHVLVHDHRSWGPILAGEKTGLPVATLGLTCCAWPGDRLAPFGLGLAPAADDTTLQRYRLLRAAAERSFAGVRAAWDEVRRDYGLPPHDGPLAAAALSRDLVLMLGTRAFDYDRRDLPPHIHYVGPLAWEPPARPDDGVMSWLATHPEDTPLVLLSASTTLRRTAALVRTGLEALASSPVAIAASLPFDSPIYDRQWPGNVYVGRYIPHAAILPRASAVVTHGGFGTVQKALARGVPLVVVPYAYDQAEVAQRVVAAGAGVRLEWRSMTADLLRRAVQEVLADERVAAGAARMAAAIARHDAAGEAASLLIGLAARGSRHRASAVAAGVG